MLICKELLATDRALVPSWLKLERGTKHINKALEVPFAMDITMVMCWCIWKERNDWLFNNEDLDHCKIRFK
jgi:hypothetical protein